MPSGGIVWGVADNLMINQESGLSLSPGLYIRVVVEDQVEGIAKDHRVLLNRYACSIAIYQDKLILETKKRRELEVTGID